MISELWKFVFWLPIAFCIKIVSSNGAPNYISSTSPELHLDSVHVALNATIVLQCRLDLNSSENIIWMHSATLSSVDNGAPVFARFAGLRHALQSQSVGPARHRRRLLIVQLQSPASQTGYYWCQLPGSGVAPTRSAPVYLAVLTGSQLGQFSDIDSLRSGLAVSTVDGGSAVVTALAGVNVALPCLMPASGSDGGGGGGGKFRWMRGDTWIPASLTTGALVSPVLLIDSVKLCDSGIYTCWTIASDGGRAVSQWKLVVVGPPIPSHSPAEAHPQSISFFSGVWGNGTRLDCPLIGRPSPSVSWLKNGQPLHIEPPFLRQLPGNGSLAIAGGHLLPSHAGLYECLGENRFGSVRLTAGTLRVEPMKKLPCLPGDDRDDAACKSANDAPEDLAENATLLFTAVCQQLGDDYCLLAWRQLPTLAPNLSGLAQTLSPVEFVLLTSDSTGRQVAYRALSGAASGEMMLAHLVPGSGYSVRLLHGGGRRDRRAASTVGRTRFRTLDAPSEAPKPPANLRLLSVTAWSVRVNWDRPSSAAAASAAASVADSGCLRVELLLFAENDTNIGGVSDATASDNAAAAILRVNCSATAAAVGADLPTQPHQLYRLEAVTVFSGGVRTLRSAPAVLRFSSLQDSPSRPPVGLTATAINGGAVSVVTVAWQPPPTAWQRGVVIGYTLQYRSEEKEAASAGKDQGGHELTVIGGGPRSCELRGLPLRRLFAVRVAARTSAGVGPFTHWLEFYTGFRGPRDMAAVFPRDLPRRDIGDGDSYSSQMPQAHLAEVLRVKQQDIILHGKKDSILLSWTRPSHVLPDKYKIYYGTRQPKEILAGEIPGDQDNYQIKNLLPDQQYFIAIMAVKASFSVETSIEAQTREGKDDGNKQPPRVPMAVKVGQVASRSAVVTWSDPQRDVVISGGGGGGALVGDRRHYEVEWGVDVAATASAAASAEPPGRRNTTELSLRIANLRPNVAYSVRVRCHVEFVGSSEYSMRAVFTSMAEAPGSPPRDLKVSRSNLPRSVMLSWLPPLEPNGRVTKYTVLYRPASAEAAAKDHVTTTADTQVVITGLKPATLYYFRVRAENSEGIGPEGNVTMFMTPDSFGQGGGVVYNTDADSVIQRASPESDSDGLSSRKWWLLISGVFILAILLLVAATTAICLCQRPRSSSSGGGGARRRRGKESASLINPQESANQQQPPLPQHGGGGKVPSSPGAPHHTAAMLVGQAQHQHQLQLQLQLQQQQQTPDLCRHADFELRAMDFSGVGRPMHHPMLLQPPGPQPPLPLLLESGPVPNQPGSGGGHFRNLSNPGYPPPPQPLPPPLSHLQQQPPPIPAYPASVSRVGSVVSPPRVDAPDFSSPGKLSSPHSSLSSSIGSASKQRHALGQPQQQQPQQQQLMSTSVQSRPYPAPPDILNPAPGSRQHQHQHQHQVRGSHATGGSSTLESQTSRSFALSTEDLDMAKTLDGLMNDLKSLTNKEFEC